MQLTKELDVKLGDGDRNDDVTFRSSATMFALASGSARLGSSFFLQLSNVLSFGKNTHSTLFNFSHRFRRIYIFFLLLLLFFLLY